MTTQRPKRKRAPQGKRPKVRKATGAPANSEKTGEASDRELFRARMRLVGKLLNSCVEELLEAEPAGDRAGRGAYLNIMGQVFDALDGLSQAIPLTDLVRISRVVAEQRRAEVNVQKNEDATQRKGRSMDNGQAPGPYRLPRHFRDMVRELYGVSLPSAENQAGAAASDAGEADQSPTSRKSTS